MTFTAERDSIQWAFAILQVLDQVSDLRVLAIDMESGLGDEHGIGNALLPIRKFTYRNRVQVNGAHCKSLAKRKVSLAAMQSLSDSSAHAPSATDKLQQCSTKFGGPFFARYLS